MNGEGNHSTEKSLGARLPPPQCFLPWTTRHAEISCPPLHPLAASHTSVLYTFALVLQKKQLFQFSSGHLAGCSEPIQSRALPEQKVGSVPLPTRFLAAPSIICKSKVWSDWHYWGPLSQKLLVFYIYVTVKYSVLLRFCQTTGREHFAGAKATPNTQLGWNPHIT